MFNQIKFQEDLASKMLGMSSFTRRFAGNSYANAGRCQQGRWRVIRSAISELIDVGYTEIQARNVVSDAQDYAALLYNAE